MKKLVVALTILTITASSALAQRYAYDPDPNVRLQMARDANIGGG